jgi:hypothetical protein
MWLPIHTELPRHIKVKRFARQLKINQAQAIGHLVMLWLWTLENASDGNLEPFTYDEICDGAGWKRIDKGSFISALIEAGFLDPDNRIHDWDDYAGNLLARREKDRLRKREERRRAKEQNEAIAEAEAEEFLDLSFGHPFL